MSWIASVGSGIWHYGIVFLVLLTVLVFVHELGHYWVARRNGVKIDVFSIGFGPELFGWYDRAGTRWKFSAIPLGGYVKFFGDADAMSSPADEPVGLTPEERKLSFHGKSLGQRAAIVAAGPIANFLFAIVVFALLFAIVGQPYSAPEVHQVVPGSAAERAGLAAGDRITRMDGEEIHRFEDILRIVTLNLDKPLNMTVLRDGREVSLTAQPVVVEERDRFGGVMRVARLGIQGGGYDFVRRGPGEAIYYAFAETYNQSVGTLQAMGQMITGRRGTDELGGPIRIAQMAGEVAQISFSSLVGFAALLSINLGLINLFPVPMLDGGHLLFYFFEAIRGKPLGQRAQEYGFRVGLILVLSLMVFATWNDLIRVSIVQRFLGLFS